MHQPVLLISCAGLHNAMFRLREVCVLSHEHKCCTETKSNSCCCLAFDLITSLNGTCLMTSWRACVISFGLLCTSWHPGEKHCCARVILMTCLIFNCLLGVRLDVEIDLVWFYVVLFQMFVLSGSQQPQHDQHRKHKKSDEAL